MYLRPDDEHGAASGPREVPEFGWTDDTSTLRLLAHVMFTLLLMALIVGVIALFI